MRPLPLLFAFAVAASQVQAEVHAFPKVLNAVNIPPILASTPEGPKGGTYTVIAPDSLRYLKDKCRPILKG